jgi:glycosyltransferase involved in cell wall biosynthesis
MKVLIGIVTYGKQRYCLDEFLLSLGRQTVKADVLFVVNNGESAYTTLIKSRGFNAVEDPKPAKTRIEKIVNGRNYIRDYALKNDYDFLLFLDSDVLIHPRALEALLATKYDVVAGIYLNVFQLDGKPVVAPVLFKDLGNGQCQLYTYEGAAKQQVLEIGAAGLGCALISKKVLKEIPFRTFNNSSTGGEDMAFFVDARAKGFKTVANTFVKCLHRPYPADDPRAKLFEWKKHVEDTTYTVELPK